MKKFSVIIPCYNEAATLEACLKRVCESEVLGWEKEVILIDDGSTDDSLKIAKNFAGKLVILEHQTNQGKGAALRKGIEVCQGQVILIQDADLEYDPQDYPSLIKPFDQGAQAVFGVRRRPYTQLLLWLNPYFWGGSFINLVANLLYLTWIKDIHSGYKAFLKEVISSDQLSESGFTFCHEITAKLLEKKVKIEQVSIGYYPRGLSEGKKIRSRDGLQALIYLVKRRLKSMV